MIKNKEIWLRFNDIEKRIHVELDSSHSPGTVKALLDNLPMKVRIYRWVMSSIQKKLP
jgi:hypothetical protein